MVKDRDFDKFRAYLKAHKLKKTPERFEILKCAGACPNHFDVETLYKLLEIQGYHVSRSTIYNTLEILCSAGVMRKLLFNTHQAVYEMADKTHSHLVCQECGKIMEIELGDLPILTKEMKKRHFTPSYLCLTVYGHCDDCLNKEDA